MLLPFLPVFPMSYFTHISAVGRYENTRDIGLEAAQQALDLFCIRGTLNLPIIQVESRHFVWWTEASKRILRIIGVSDLKTGVSASAADIYGNPQAPITSPVAWHPSFRYFRVSQVSTDLLDAYRNLYLALESILTTMIPVARSDAGESNWLKRALQQINTTLPLAPYAPHGSTNPPDDIHQDIYADTRTAIFHAKQGRPVFLPHRLSTRAGIVDTLGRLSGLYLALVNKEFGIQRASGVITYGGFDAIMQQFINKNNAMAVSDDDALITDNTLINPNGGLSVYFAASHDPNLNRLGYKYWLGEVSSANFGGLQRVKRLGLIHNSELKLVMCLDDPIRLSDVDVLQVQLGVRLVNVNNPRATFET